MSRPADDVGAAALEAVTLSCTGCGGHLRVPAGARARCPFCGHVQAPAVLGPAAQYGARAQAALADAVGHAEAAENHYDDWDPNAPHQRRMAGIFAAVLAGAIAAGVAHELGQDAPVVAGAAAIAMALLVALTLVATRDAGPAIELAAGEILAACPTCGAAAAMAVGQVAQACRYCRSDLVPSRALIDTGLARAHQVRRASAIGRYRYERAQALARMPEGRDWRLLVLILVVGAGGAALVGGVLLARRALDPPAVSLVAVGLLSLALAPLVLGARLRGRALRRAFEAIASQLGGVVARSSGETATWLDTYWVGPHDDARLVASRHEAALARVHGYPTLIAAGRCDGRWYVEVLTAACVDALARGEAPRWSAAAAWERDHLARMGFATEISEAGITVAGGPDIGRQIERQPRRAHLLVTVAAHAARLAAALECAPAEPMPA